MIETRTYNHNMSERDPKLQTGAYMYKTKKIGVVVPAYNEEKFIGQVIDTMPAWVDGIYVANDASTDKTGEIVADRMQHNKKIELINRRTCGGVGAAVLTGHARALQDGMDVIAVMAGDGQMDPAILHSIVGPVAEGKADYCKGTRLSSSSDKKEMPALRSFGNLLLTNLSRISSGYWHVSDPQDGYTAISAETLKKLDFNRIEKGFAFENDMLTNLNVINATVLDIRHPAIYRGQTSKINYIKFIFRTGWILFKGFLWRIWTKYIGPASNRGYRHAKAE